MAALAALSLALPGSAWAISRADALARAQTWVDSPVPYSQTKYFGGYRTDCSGFASMVWHLSGSYTTRTLHDVSYRVLVADLKPGDVMLKYDSHVRVFYGWVDVAHTQYVAYEQTGPTTRSSIKSMNDDWKAGYKPYRHNKIVDSAPSKNAIVNPTFDVWNWLSGTNKAPQAPVWWSVSGGAPRALVLRRTDFHQTGRSSLALVNPSTDTRNVVQLSQVAPVGANETYTLSTWARTDGAPGSLELRMQYLDGSGKVLKETATDGKTWGLDAHSLKTMSLTAVAPPGTAKANVVVNLSGGAVPATGAVGVTAVLDYFTLVQVQLPATTLSLSRSASTVTHGRSVVLRGELNPDGAAPASIRIQYKRPGSNAWVIWRYVPSSRDGSYSTKWNTGSTTTKGTWSWRAYFGATGSYLGINSAPVTVHVD